MYCGKLDPVRFAWEQTFVSDKPGFGVSNADGDATPQTFDSDHGQAIMPVIDLQYPAALTMSNSQSDVHVSQ